MDKVSLDPYIFFAGTGKEAMDFYQTVFGGELHTQTYDEAPGETPAGMEGKLMHARLAGEVNMMASDTTEADTHGHGKIHLTLGGKDEEKLRGIFEKLSDGGEVRSPLEKAFWGDTFGSLVDQYGVNWMVNISSGEHPG